MKKILSIVSKVIFLLVCSLIVSACKKVTVTMPSSSNISFHAGNDDYVINAVLKTMDGGYLVSGFVTPSVSLYTGVYLLKYDGNGKELWYKTFPNADIVFSMSIAETSDGGFVIVGESSPLNVGAGGLALYPRMFKTDANGNLEWIIHPSIDYYLTGVCSDQFGYFYVCGNYGPTNANFLYKLNNAGTKVWYKTFVGNIHIPGAGFNAAKMAVDNNGGLLMAATVVINKTSNTPQLELIRFDTAGKFQKSTNFPNVNFPTASSQLPLVFNKMERMADGSYDFVFNAVSQLGTTNYFSNVLHEITTDQNLQVISSKVLDSITPITSNTIGTPTARLDNYVTYYQADNMDIMETIPTVFNGDAGSLQGKYTLVRKNQNGQTINQQSFDGWPCGMFLDASNHLYIFGLTVNPLNETRGIFRLYVDESIHPY